MQLKGVIFSTEEMEEIELLKELCENMSVDGVEIVCFKVLSDLLNTNVRFEDFSKEVLQTTQLQMNDYVHFWSDIDWYNSRMVESVSMIFDRMLGNRGQPGSPAGLFLYFIKKYFVFTKYDKSS